MEEGSWVTNLQSEFNYLDSFTFYSVFKISASSAPGGVGQVGGGVCRVIRVSLDEFRNVPEIKIFQTESNYLD